MKSALHHRQVAALAGKGFQPYHVDENGTHLMKPRTPNSVPLNTTVTVFTGGLWLLTAMPIISTAKADERRLIPNEGVQGETTSVMDSLLGLLIIFGLIFIIYGIGLLFRYPILLVIPVVGITFHWLHRKSKSWLDQND
jgi:hypothetical protein